jgi:3-carboxy-cis,cis-muconate cycloisomerase
MISSSIESYYFSDLYSSSEMREIFSDKSRIEAWLKTESALALAQAENLIIPREAADKIVSAAKYENIDIDAMKKEYERVGFPISPLVHQLATACDSESSRWIHWGATTQDVIDTGLVLQMREGLVLIELDIDTILGALKKLVYKHRDTVMVGRTFQQQAAPITFGYKVAVWLDEMYRHWDRLQELKQRVLVGQFGGAVGTLATLGDQGISVRRDMMKQLDLGVPNISWHTARDGWAELVHWLAMIGATLGKIASEVSTLMRTEINEVREPYQSGRGASSTMPQKRNPINCPPIIAIAHRLRECVGSQLMAMIQDHERAVAGQPLEWLVIPESFLLLSGALKHSRTILEHLDVDAEQMNKNINTSGGFLMAESVMMGLAKKLGRAEAHHLVSEVAGRAIDSGNSLRDELLSEPQIMSAVTESIIDELLDPSQYLGCASEMIDMVLAKVESAL